MANEEASAGFIRSPLQLGLVKPGTIFRHEVLVPLLPTYRRAGCPSGRDNRQTGLRSRRRSSHWVRQCSGKAQLSSLLPCR